MRCRFVTSAVIVIGGAVELVVAAAVVVVAVASRSFFRRRNRDVSSTSTVVDGVDVDFLGLAADGVLTIAVGGDICCAFASFVSADEIASADRLPVDSQPLAVREVVANHLASKLLESSEQRIVKG